MKENNIYEDDFKKGDCALIEDKGVLILKKGKLVKKIECQKSSFVPETPFIIQFN